MACIPLICRAQAQAPSLLIGMHVVTLLENPDWSLAPQGERLDIYRAVKAAGIEAIQCRDADVAREAGLIPTAFGRVDTPAQALEIARFGKGEGFIATTLHVGSGFEADAESANLVAAIIDASIQENYPLFIETHRATITQDMKRTLDLVQQFPEIRFNGDFSHWYTGQEMPYGDIDEKFERLTPVTRRTCFIHGRVSAPGAMQIPVDEEHLAPHVAVFRKFWQRCFIGFLQNAKPGDCFGFFPELLPASFHYARLIKDEQGNLREECDRWQQAFLIIDIARQCWDSALQSLTVASKSAEVSA